MIILMWGFWGFCGKLALEKNMAPTSIFLAEVFISACVCDSYVVDLLAQARGLFAGYILERLQSLYC
jgi:hypothetical protein